MSVEFEGYNDVITQEKRKARVSHWCDACSGEISIGHEYSEVHHTEPPPEIAELAFLTGAEVQDRLK